MVYQRSQLFHVEQLCRSAQVSVGICEVFGLETARRPWRLARHSQACAIFFKLAVDNCKFRRGGGVPQLCLRKQF